MVKFIVKITCENYNDASNMVFHIQNKYRIPRSTIDIEEIE